LSTSRPPFRADHVGSFLREPALQQARASFREGKLDAAVLRAAEDQAIKNVVALQRDAGLKSATDGELRRKSWSGDFLEQIGNVVSRPSNFTVRFQTKDGERRAQPPGFYTEGKLTLDKGIFIDDFKYLKSVTGAGVTPKLTIPSPTMLHFRAGRAGVDQKAYPAMEQFFADLAGIYRKEIQFFSQAGGSYLQLDDTNFAYLCDPSLRAEVQNIVGENPDELTKTYAKLISEVTAGKPAGMTVCMHLCRGNSASAWVGSGGYDPVAEVMFNETAVDGYFLEYDSDRAGDFSPLRFLPKGNKRVVLGLVSSKYSDMEKKDDLKRRIDEATKFAPLDQLCISTQCGFASTETGNAITFDDQRRKLDLVVETAREVWGEA